MCALQIVERKIKIMHGTPWGLCLKMLFHPISCVISKLGYFSLNILIHQLLTNKEHCQYHHIIIRTS